MSFLIKSKHNDYQPFDSIENIAESSFSSNGQVGALNTQSGSSYHVSRSAQSHSSQTTPASIIPLPVNLTAIVADYCYSSQLNSILPQEARDVFYRNFKRNLSCDPKISSVINEIGCFSTSESNEKFCLETIDNVRRFASKTEIYKANMLDQMQKMGEQLKVRKIRVSIDLDIMPVIKKIQTVIDIDCWQLWMAIAQRNYFGGYNREEMNKITAKLNDTPLLEALQDAGIYKNRLINKLEKLENIPDASEVREWFNRPENQPILSSVTYLEITGSLDGLGNLDSLSHLRTFPKEILKMKNLTALKVGYSSIKYIPEEIVQLKALTHITFCNTTYEAPFTKINKKLY